MHLTASGFILLSVNFNVLDESNLFDIGQGRTWGKGNPIDQVPSLCAWGGGGAGSSVHPVGCRPWVLMVERVVFSGSFEIVEVYGVLEHDLNFLK